MTTRTIRIGTVLTMFWMLAINSLVNAAAPPNLVLSLNGTGAYMSVPSAPELQPGEAVTVEGWVYAFSDRPDRGPSLISKGDGISATSQRTYHVGWNPPGAVAEGIAAELFAGSTNYTALRAAAPASQWFHFAFTYDSASGLFRLYTNGVAASENTRLAGAKLRQTTLPVIFGAGPDYPGVVSHGYLDEVRIWSRARTPEEIQQSYRCRLTGAEAGLEAYWHFEGSDGADESGHGHDGSLFSGAAVVEAPAGLTLFPPPCPVDPRGPVPGPSGCVAWWSGDGTAADIQRTNHGTLEDGAAFEPGLVGQAFFLEGVDDYPLFGQDAAAVSVAAGPDLHFGPDSTFTLMAWVNTVLAPGNYPNGPGIYQMVIGKCDTADTWDWGFYIAPSGNVVASANGAASMTRIQPGIWYHIATTYSNGTHEIYVNGTLEGRNATGPLITQSTGAVALGRKGESLQNQSFFKGLLDEVQVYSRVLAPEEIEAVALSGAVGLCKAPRFTQIATDADWVLLRLIGQTEKTVEIQGVTVLPGWVSLLTLPNPTGALQLIDPALRRAPIKLYRALQH